MRRRSSISMRHNVSPLNITFVRRNVSPLSISMRRNPIRCECASPSNLVCLNFQCATSKPPIGYPPIPDSLLPYCLSFPPTLPQVLNSLPLLYESHWIHISCFNLFPSRTFDYCIIHPYLIYRSHTFHFCSSQIHYRFTLLRVHKLENLFSQFN